MRRNRSVGTLAVMAAACGVFATAGAAQAAAPVARSAASAGVVYGGVTPQGLPVVFELRKNHRALVRATVALRLTCTSGQTYVLADGYHKGNFANRRFHGSFGPETTQNDDGTSTESSGSLLGKTNARATKLSGTWQLVQTQKDATGNVTDVCDSGIVHWTAKQ